MLKILENKIVDRFEYQTLGQVKKQYDAKLFPAPTRVFSTLNKAQTAFFKKAMKDKNSVIYKATSAGRKVHHAIETGNIKDQITQAAVDCFEREIAIDIDEVWGAEQGLISVSNKYVGKFDCVGVFRGKSTMWDYKKVNKLKTPSQIKNYIKQCAAYALAHDEMFGTNLEQIAVLMVGGKEIDSMQSRVFTFGGDELEIAKQEFKNDVQKYYSQFIDG